MTEERNREGQEPEVVITGGQLPLSFRAREMWRYRDLILLLAKKTFIIRYKQTVLGVLWAVLRPLITALILTVAFGRIVGVDTGEVPGLIFYLSSYALWGFFAETIRTNAGTFTDNAALFGKVYFPRLAVPASNLLVSLLTFAIQMVLLLIVLAWYVLRGSLHPLPAGWLLLPLVVLQTGVLGVSIGIMISSLTTKYRDLTMLVDFGIQLWMYISPVVYPLSFVKSPALRRLLCFNPVSAPLEAFRALLLGEGSVSTGAVAGSIAFTLAAALVANVLFSRVEKDFMDTV